MSARRWTNLCVRPLVWAWPAASVGALIPTVLLLRKTLSVRRYVHARHMHRGMRILTAADMRRGVLYTVVLVGNTLTGTLAALRVLPVPAATAAYATLGSAMFGAEAWLELRDMRILQEEREARDVRRAADSPN